VPAFKPTVYAVEAVHWIVRLEVEFSTAPVYVPKASEVAEKSQLACTTAETVNDDVALEIVSVYVPGCTSCPLSTWE